MHGVPSNMHLAVNVAYLLFLEDGVEFHNRRVMALQERNSSKILVQTQYSVEWLRLVDTGEAAGSLPRGSTSQQPSP